ncbi:MAG: PAS domain S-box protein [Anaerolineales bacterium]|nr:PAS domain S-box protein [Anaerolineales bacterium]
MKRKKLPLPVRISLLYLIIGFMWILFSDHLLALLATDFLDLVQLQTYKGWFFVISTAFLLFIVLQRKLSEKQEADRALEQSERRLSTLISNLPGVAFRGLPDASRTMIFLSDGCEDLLGYSAGELQDNRILSYAELIHPEDLERVRLAVQQGIEKNHAHEIQYRIRTSSGEERWVLEQGLAVCGKDKVVDGIEGLLTDISDQVSAQSVLEQQARVFENISDAVVIMDRQLIVQDWNPSAERIFGYKKEEVLGVSIETIFSSKKVPLHLLNLSLQVYGGKRWSGEVVFFHRDGFQIIGELSILALKQQHGEESAVLWVIHNISDRKRAETALHESEARYRSLTNDVLDHAAVGVVILDARQNVVWLNTAVERMLSLSRHQLLGRSGEALLQEYLQPLLKKGGLVLETILANYRDGIYQVGSEFSLSHGNMDRTIHVEYSSQPILTGFYAGGRIEYLVDITEREQALEEIRRRAQQQEAINEAIAAASQVSDIGELLDTALNSCMRALETSCGIIWAAGILRTYGIPEGQQLSVENAEAALMLENFDILQTFHEGEKKIEANNSLINALGQEKAQAWITAPIEAEGKIIGGISLASETPRLWEPDERDLIQVIGRQLGGAVERLGLLETTQEQAGQLKLILDTVQEGIITLNSEHRILIANPAARAHLSLLSDRESGEILERLGDWEIEKLLEIGPDTRPGFITVKDPDRFFELHVNKVERGQDDIIWTLVLREITEMRQAQEKVIRQERRAAIGQLASGIAHDFNNIMAAVILYSEMLLEESGLSERGHERLHMIMEQAERAARLTNQILDFSRSAVMDLYPVDLVPFMNSFQIILSRTLPENINVSVDYGEDKYLVNMDPARMQQALFNLAINARDAMKEGGELRFELDRENYEEETVPLEGMEPGNWVRISVFDTGTGMEDSILKHLFEPFFSTKGPGEGTGLGLAQVDGIVKQHNGHIYVESTPGSGSSFHIYLPVLRAGLVPGIIHDVESMLDRSKHVILVVEDDSAARSAVAELLESLDYRVLQASSGQEALDTFAVYGETIDVVLSDMVMPGISGEELFTILREKYPNIKMLVMTGYPLGEEERDLLEKGVVAWLQKPINSTNLAAAISSIFHARGSTM